MAILTVLVLPCLLKAHPEKPDSLHHTGCQQKLREMYLGAEVIEMNLKQGPRLVLHLKARLTSISEESSQDYANRDMG